jgi:protein SCO1/2
MSLRGWLWTAAAVAVLGFAGLVLIRHEGASQGPTATQAAAIGGPFHMVDQTGKPVDQTLLNGKWSAVFFGYTYCPDVCPTTLQMLGAASRGLGGRANAFQVVFVSVDPARDTPKQLKDYLSNSVFPPGAIGLTGTPQEVAAIAQAYGVYYQKQGAGSDYAVNHSAAIYLMNPNGRFDSVISPQASPDQAKAAILKAMDGGAANG